MGGSDLSFSMLIRLMDGWSGPADKVRQSMRNVAQGAREMQRTMGRKIKTGFSADEVEAALSRSERRITEARGRLMGAAAMAVTLGTPVIQAGNFEEKLIDFANLAEIDRERVVQLKQELNALRALTGQSNSQLLEGVATYVGKGMDLDAALAALPATGRAAKATKSQFDEMANSGYAVMDNLGVAPDKLRQAFDIMAKSGKEGSFELAAMARKFPEITAGAKALKMDGVDAVASLSAALQIAMKSAGSEDQAATNMTNFLGKITAPDTVKKFRKFGVDVEKEMRIALERGADPLEHMLLVIKKMTDGDAFKMGELFADKQVLDFLRAMIPNMEEYQRIKAEALGADGVIDADYERVMQGFNEETRQLKNSVAALLGASGALLPIFTDIIRQIRFGVEAVSAWTAANPELTATIVKGTAALLAFGIGTRLVGFGFAILQGGILRTVALFLKFDKAGKNISLLGRAARRAGWSISRLYRGGRGLARLMRTPLRWSIAPLRWTASLVPTLTSKAFKALALGGGKLTVRALLTTLSWGATLIPFLTPLKFKALAIGGKKLAVSSLVTALTWTSTLLPGVKWSGVISRSGKFGMNAAGWGKLITPLKWAAKSGLRFIPVIGWGLLAADLGMFAWDLVMNKLGWSDWINAGGLQDAWNALPTLYWNDKIKTDRPEISETKGFNSLPEKKQSAATQMDEQLRESASNGNLATDEYTGELSSYIADLHGQISALEQKLANIKDSPIAESLRGPIREELAVLQKELDWANSEHDAAAVRKEALRDAITEATGAPPVDGVNEASILAALEKVRADAANHADRATGEAIEQALTPLTQAIRAGKERAQMAPEVPPSPEARPEPKAYETAQPNVTVESTFESNPKIDVNVKVSMPISISREQHVDNRAIAARAGRETGALTERAVRRSLDDAANVE